MIYTDHCKTPKVVSDAYEIIRIYNDKLYLEEEVQRLQEYERLYNEQLNKSVTDSWRSVGQMLELVLNNYIEVTPIDQYIEQEKEKLTKI